VGAASSAAKTKAKKVLESFDFSKLIQRAKERRGETMVKGKENKSDMQPPRIESAGGDEVDVGMKKPYEEIQEAVSARRRR